MQLHVEPAYWWTEVRIRGGRWELAAFWLAVQIAKHRSGGAGQYFNPWLEKWQGGPDHSPELRDCLLAFFGSESIGTPEHKAPDSHLQGFVAEHIWHALAEEGELGLGVPIRVEGPDWSVTDSGGDGLVVYRTQELEFRLWELKAHSSGVDVRAVVNGACRQLDEKALRYLARFSKVGQNLAEPDLQLFYGRLPELWRRSADTAGGGVGVSTVHLEGSDYFGNMGSYWDFVSESQRLGLLVMIDNFVDFAARVREHLWRGL